MLGPVGGGVGPCSDEGRWWLALPACAWALEAFRSNLGAWLQGSGWPLEELAAVVTVANELVSNAVEHAYPPVEGAAGLVGSGEAVGVVWAEAVVITLAETGRRRLWLVVRDEGLWDPVGEILTRDRAAEPLEGSGRLGSRGLAVARELMDEVAVHRGGVDAPVDRPGTVVTVLSPEVGPVRPR